MAFKTLIDPQTLAEHIGDPDWAIIDCRFVLADPEQGQKDYMEGHIPGAVYAHLDRDLCGPIIPGQTGRHPLPKMDEALQTFSSLGIDSNVQVVAYDAAGGALAAARLWWMLRWLGHEAVAVLDGGWQKWLQENLPVRPGEEKRQRRKFIPRITPSMEASSQEVEVLRHSQNHLLVDVRAAERFRGENETIDPVAGHIPGAVNLPYANNLTAEGDFRSTAELREQFEEVLGDTPPEKAIFYCGSGVTAIQSILAMVHAGLGEAKLYSGSWSEWITDPERPVATKDPNPSGE
jgi:thiosulfate/3-mercaptopyruvate sulfurtransferase